MRLCFPPRFLRLKTEDLLKNWTQKESWTQKMFSKMTLRFSTQFAADI